MNDQTTTQPEAIDEPPATKPKAVKPKKVATSAADVFAAGLGSLHDAPASTGPGKPSEIALTLIDEDPEQPRREFDDVPLQELAETVRERGVKTPISLRPHPQDAGRYMINHGARRYRASQIAGKTTIPAYVDPDHNATDQVIENVHRDNLKPREIAEHIRREMATGKRKNVIAKELGKSPQYVSHYVAFLDLPPVVAEAFDTGKCSDVTLANDLGRLHKIDPEAVEFWIGDTDEITRGTVKRLRETIEESQNPPEPPVTTVPPADDNKEPDEGEGSSGDKFSKAVVAVVHDDRKGRLLLKTRPTEEGQGWIKYDDDGSVIEVDLSTVTIVALIEG